MRLRASCSFPGLIEYFSTTINGSDMVPSLLLVSRPAAPSGLRMHPGPNGPLTGAGSPRAARVLASARRIDGVPDPGTDGGPRRGAAGTAPPGGRAGPPRPADASRRRAG